MNKQKFLPLGFSSWLDFYKHISKTIEFTSNDQLISYGEEGSISNRLLEITVEELKAKCFDEMCKENPKMLSKKIQYPEGKLIFIDYHNYHEKTYYMCTVNKEIFDLDWETICNEITTSRFNGLTALSIQDYLQDNGIRFHWNGAVTKEYIDRMFKVEFNKTVMKLVEHSNVGNY